MASLVFVLVAIEVARPLGGQWQRLTITMSSTRKSGAELSKLTLNNIKNGLIYSLTFLHSQGTHINENQLILCSLHAASLLQRQM